MSECFHRSSDSQAIQYRLDDEVWIVKRCRALGTYRECLATFLKLPTIETITEAKPYTGVVFQVLRVFGESGVDSKYCGDPTTARRNSLVTADGNHVTLDELAKLNAGVVPSGYKIDGVIGRGHLQDDLGIGLRTN